MTDNLWILTEEKPKNSVITQILHLYARDFDTCIFCSSKQLRILPVIKNDAFSFCYSVQGLSLEGIGHIYIKTVSGSSSFLDFLVFRQPEEPTPQDVPVMAIEETKTTDSESRNTGVYQRGSKFVYIENFYPKIRLYMLYNGESGDTGDKQPSGTSVFGTNLLLTLGIHIVGRKLPAQCHAFQSLDDLIRAKARMNRTHRGNVTLGIERKGDCVRLSGRLEKPAGSGKLGHDPNIGALSLLAACCRRLGFTGDLIVTGSHGLTQAGIEHSRGNKFLFICQLHHIQLEGLTLQNMAFPSIYWHYEMKSEKVASILLHIVAENHGMREIYQNHAGCERGYFICKGGTPLALPKKDQSGNKLYIPDVVLHDPDSKQVFLIEGKQLSTLGDGLIELRSYDAIEKEYIHESYPDCTVTRWVSIFGGTGITPLPDSRVLLYLNRYGDVYLSKEAPACIRSAFLAAGLSLH